MYSYSDLKDVLNNAESKEDLNDFVSVIDELFLSGEIVLTDEEWNQFTLDLKQRFESFKALVETD